MTFYFLDHSGFAVDTGARWLVFDYFTDEPNASGLCDGVIDPMELEGKPVMVFSSHSHHDHFNPIIFSWRDKISDIQYVLSDDIVTTQEVLFVAPHQTYQVDEVFIETLASTDQGVAFLVQADGFTIYHAGDLNDWHWEGETEAYNEQMKERYQAEMTRLHGRKIDLAFIPVDPRLGKAFCFGLEGFLKQAEASVVVPMHFWGDYSVMEQLNQWESLQVNQNKICYLTKRGQKEEVGETGDMECWIY